MGKDKGEKLPRSVKALEKSWKEWAKKNGYDYENKKDKKAAKEEYSFVFLEGLDRAMEIVMKHPNSDLANRVKRKIESAIARPKQMKEVARVYSDNRKNYRFIVYLPNVIMATIQYLEKNADQLSAEERVTADNIDAIALTEFCDKILKKPKKHYESFGFSSSTAFALASLIPSAKILEKGYWHRALIMTLYSIAETDSIDISSLFKAIASLDKSEVMKKRDLKKKFWLEFILMKNSNKLKNLNDSQKEFHQEIQDEALKYLNELSKDELEIILRKYIKRRKESENNNGDPRRIFRFTDYANSNSPYTRIKSVVEKIISKDPDLEQYLK